MRKLAGFLFLTLLLAGCVSPEQQAAADRAQCGQYGFRADSDGFASCMMTLSTNREAMMHRDFAEQNKQYQQQYQQQEMMSVLRDLGRRTRQHQDDTGSATRHSAPAVDTSPHFDKSGNPNYDTDGNYDGCHGAGCLVDPPEE